MNRSLRQFVRERASLRCEYCHQPDSTAIAAVFHLEHILAKQHGGSDSPDNACWSCHRCNLRKGPNLSGRDPRTGKVVRLFDPRRQLWKRHFRWRGAVLVGRTQIAQATIDVLNINDAERLELRQILMQNGEWPED